jgi:hypothetical protein
MVFWFIIYALYGVVWSVILTVSERERSRSLLHVVYLVGVRCSTSSTLSDS